MGKKVKIGKQRRDKAYWAAKEIGYRSRASFKLIQLNRKWEFLQKSSVCIDLCAAPGSWMQVCRENMPMSSLVVGVDLVPIKPIPGCIALQDDITTEKCRADLRKELKTAKADLVLHDGAPNVGKNWIHDAYQQSLLTLHAFKLATEFLCKGGWFVTKVFRSKDYQSLIWVLGQFFKKVHATKPAASRNESAEIFVVCQYFLAPDKIDPKFLDPRHVFSDVEVEDKKAARELINPERQKKKPASLGYGDGLTLLYKEAAASEFILGNGHIQILNESNAIRLDEERIAQHPRTTVEIRECIKDLKVLGMKELRLLKKWRDALRKEFEAAGDKEKEEATAAPLVEKTAEEEEGEELAEVEQQIADLKDEERRAARRKKKRELKEKQKRALRLNLKMIIPGDEGPTASEEGLFRISELRSGEDLTQVLDSKADQVIEDSEDEERRVKPKYEKYSKEGGSLDSEGLWYNEGEMEEGDSEDEDEEEEQEELGLQEEQTEEASEDEEVNEKEEEVAAKKTKNPLLTSLSTETTEERRERKAELWFQKIGDIDSDSDLEEGEIQRALNIVQKKGGKIRKKEEPVESGYTSGSGDEARTKEIMRKEIPVEDSDSESDSDSDSDSDNPGVRGSAGSRDGGGFEVVPQQQQPRGKKRPLLSAEELALGEKLIHSKKSKRDIMDAGWNRYMFDDSGLPDWFEKEEEMHMKRRPELDPAVVEKYRGRQKELNVKTIKKVVEAKARKKRRVAKKLEKAKKKTAALLENNEVSSREKAAEINKMYKAAAAAGKKRDVAYVVARKHCAAKRAKRPAGVKGPYKQVDPRMKKDTTGKRGNAGKKKNQKRRLKGKQAKPTKQFNTNR